MYSTTFFYINSAFFSKNILYLYLFIIIFFFYINIFKLFFLLKYEKNIDNYIDLKKYLYYFFFLLNITVLYFFIYKYKKYNIFIGFFANFLTVIIFVLSYVFLDPIKFSISLSGFSKEKNWFKNSTD